MCPGSPPIFKRPILILRTLRSSARRNPTAHPCALPATNLLSCSLAQPSPLRVLPENSIRRGFASSGRIVASLRTMLAILGGNRVGLKFFRGAAMSSSEDNTDRKCINIHEDYELRYWSNKFGVTPSELRLAVNKVGVISDDVARDFGILKVQTAPVVSP